MSDTCLGHFWQCPFENKILNMAKTQEHEELNTLSQNKESIHAPNSTSAFDS